MARAKLTKAVHDRIVEALTAGSYREIAADYAGIHRVTLWRWLEQGEADDEQDKDTPYRNLCNAVKSAEARFEISALGHIEQAAQDGSWQADAWRLERKHPTRWGRRDRVELEHRGNLNVGSALGQDPISIEADTRQEIFDLLGK